MKPHRSFFFSLLIFLLLLPSRPFAVERETATVVRAVDGDTLEVTVKGRTEKVRLIGVDTPEVHESQKLHRDAARTKQDEATIKALGKRASDFTKSIVRAGDQVELEYGQESRDRYRRILAFVWLTDGRMLNETIICEGYANALTRYPFRPDYMERFRTCERQAREQKKGLWADDQLQPTAPADQKPTVASADGEIRGNKKSRIYHLPGCPSYSRVGLENRETFVNEEEAMRAGYRKAKNCK